MERMFVKQPQDYATAHHKIMRRVSRPSLGDGVECNLQRGVREGWAHGEITTRTQGMADAPDLAGWGPMC